MKKKIGIMGGTFDPIHIGHLILGEKAYEQFSLDKVRFMPAGNPPHKKNRRGRATDEQRVEMVQLAISSNPHFELCLDEMNADGYSYTYRTLERFCRENPEEEYYFIIGADSLFDFDSWREPERICRACYIVVATRNQTSNERLDETMERMREKFHGTFLKLDTPNLDISSNHIRQWIEEGRTIQYYVPDGVRAYIEKNHMYKDCERNGKRTI